MIANKCFPSKSDPKNMKEALNDEYWVNANIIGTKWTYKNKSGENENITRNKACLVAQDYTQIKGVYFDKTFTPVAHLEALKRILGVSCILKSKI